MSGAETPRRSGRVDRRDIFDKRMTGRGPDRNERNAVRETIDNRGSGSSGPKSSLVRKKPVDKRGSEVADSSLMTKVKPSISIRSLLVFAPRAVSSGLEERWLRRRVKVKGKREL